MALFFQDAPKEFEMETFRTLKKNGGHLEWRGCRKLTKLDWLEEKSAWPGLKAVFAIDRRTTTNEGTRRETAYSSDCSAQKLLKMMREH